MSDYIRHHAVPIDYKKDENWTILSEIEQSIKKKIEAIGTPLKDWDISINYGIKTGLNEAFIISKEKRDELIAQDPKSAEIIRPILRGRDIKRYSIDFQELYLINTHNGYTSNSGEIVPPIDITDYPAIKNWFDNGIWNAKIQQATNIERLTKRTDQGITPYNLRSLAYMDDFNQQKIIFSRISGDEPAFAIDDLKMFTNDTGYIITGSSLAYLLEQLTSPEIWFAFKKFYMGGGIEKEFKVNNLINLPIPKPDAQLVLSKQELAYIRSQI